MRQGLLAAAAAYFIWGLFPIYWRWLAEVPALQIMAHRILWCVVWLVLWLSLREGWRWLATIHRRQFAALTLSASLVAANWWLYIWAVNAGHVVETSLGYFINPLVSVLLGIVILRERLNRAQTLAVAIAAAGVLWLSVQAGRPPWIALALALSFGSYGLIRKLVNVPAAQGLFVESVVLLPVAVGVLSWAQWQGHGAFGHNGFVVDGLLVLAGLVTALPLVMFAYGARRIPLSMVGLLQYLAPTLQLLCGVFLFGEPFTADQALGFAAIWAALGLVAADGLWRLRRARTA